MGNGATDAGVRRPPPAIGQRGASGREALTALCTSVRGHGRGCGVGNGAGTRNASGPTTYGAPTCRTSASMGRPQVTLYSVSIKIFRREAPPTTPDRPPGPGNDLTDSRKGGIREGPADRDKKGPGGRAGEVVPPWGGRKGGIKTGISTTPPGGGQGGESNSSGPGPQPGMAKAGHRTGTDALGAGRCGAALQARAPCN